MVTVLMSVYETPAALLDHCVDSILRQTWSDFEFLILDDGTRREETRDGLEQAASRDARIRLFREPHRGLTATLNVGLARAKGDLIARQDADDWSEPERLLRQVAFLSARPDIALVGSAAWMHQQDGTPLWTAHMPETQPSILNAFWSGNPFVHGSVMFRAPTARHAGGYREDLGCSQDYDFFWRLTEAGGGANLAEPLYHYRYTSGSVSSSRAIEQARSEHAARESAMERRGRAMSEELPPDAALRALLKQADHLTLAGDYARAWHAYGDLIRSYPCRVLAWAKLARLGVFRVAPPMRQRCFR